MYYGYGYGSRSLFADFPIVLTILSIFGIIVGIAIMIAFANRMQEIAESKGHKSRFWAWCFWLPLFGALMVVALPDLKARSNYDGFDSDELPVLNAEGNTSDSLKDDELPEL